MDDERLAQLRMGLAHQEAKRWSEAEQVFREFTERWPQDPRGLQLLGECYRIQGRSAEAIATAREALALKPDFGPAHFVLGTALLTANDFAEAEPHLRLAAEQLPNHLGVLINFGACLRRLHKEREALPIYQRAAQLSPRDANLKVNVGLALAGCGDFLGAERWFEQALQAEPRNVTLIWGFADACRQAGLAEKAVPLYQEALRLNPMSAAYRGLAEAWLDLGEIERSRAVLQTAIERHPNHADVYSRLGEVLTALGDMDGAAAAYRTAMRIDPHFHSALGELGRLLGKSIRDEDRALMEESLQEPGALNHCAVLRFGLANAEDACGNYARASELLLQANAAMKEYRQSEGKGWDPAESDEFVDRTIATFTPEYFRRTAGFGVSSEKPVFVFGMPRSGSTLIEQILASHSRVCGLGEWALATASWNQLPAAMGMASSPLECLPLLTAEATRHCANGYLSQIARLSKGAGERLVDKRLENWVHLGWLATMFPKARFIHCCRDLRDVALSCWMNNFLSIDWANDLGQIAARMRQYRRAMAHWREVLPVPILELQYERLVADQEGESRRLIEWLGLQWEPACLEFHRTQRSVRTASDIQVRKPIFSQSIGRWRHYTGTLRPLIEELKLGFD